MVERLGTLQSLERGNKKREKEKNSLFVTKSSLSTRWSRTLMGELYLHV